VSAAIAQAWQIVDPDFALQPVQVHDIPSLGNLEQILAVMYESGNQHEKVVSGLGQLYEGIVYVGLIQADLDLVSFQQRAAQIRVIQTGFTIYAMTDTDLSRVKPLPVNTNITTELEAYIADAMQRFRIPGVAVALVQNDRIVYAKGFGVRQRGQTVPVTPETLMLIGSVSKTMTTMMMATMADDGLLTWDTPVVNILPSFAVADPAVTPRLTMRHLVCSCTGVPQRDFE
jgi:CubicO group peptidase (beta-lactamase class C family)